MSNESTNIIETMSAELEHLRPMEASLEMAEADVKAYKQRIAVLEKEVKRLQWYHDAEATKWLAENQKLKEERRWRKFSEEKPDDKHVVLVYGEEWFETAIYHDDGSIDFGDDIHFSNITEAPYWMPLPEKPKDDKFKEAK